MLYYIRPVAFALLALIPLAVRADEAVNAKIDKLIAPALTYAGVQRFDIGVTRSNAKIPALITRDDLDLHSPKTRITLVDLHGEADPVSLAALKWFSTAEEAAAFRERFALSAVPVVYPDIWARRFANGNATAAIPTEAYPPAGNSYSSDTNPEAQYLWRWLGMHAPDLVLVLDGSDQEHDLATELSKGQPSNVASIPAKRLQTQGDALIGELKALLTAGKLQPSPARLELQRRLALSPLQMADQLAKHYGDKLNPCVYTQAVALIGRLHLGELSDDAAHRAAVERIVAPYVSGERESLPTNSSGSQLSGHLIFSELARDGGEQYAKLAQRAADLGFDDAGMPQPTMPFHNEMSDAVFMGCPILVQAGRLTGEAKYFDMALRHYRFIRGHCLRDDGLYRHSPLDESAWGRGNGFPALGLALCLSDMPQNHPAYAEMLADFRKHMAALAKHQDATGMWHQVADHSGSYREFTSTAMITFAMLRGLQRGWLDAGEYAPIVEQAWQALQLRIGPDGQLVDVCTGTGKQRSLRDYLDRTAILGRDERGGAMAILVATEMEAYRRSRTAK